MACDGSFSSLNNSQARAKPAILRMKSMQLLCQIGGSEFLTGLKGANWNLTLRLLLLLKSTPDLLWLPFPPACCNHLLLLS